MSETSFARAQSARSSNSRFDQQPKSLRGFLPRWHGNIALGLSIGAAFIAAESQNAIADSPGQTCVTTTNAESTTTICTPNSTPSTPAPKPKAHHHPKKHKPTNSTGIYENPLRDISNLRAWRIDEGVDYHGHGPVKALGVGVVTEATNRSSFFAAEGGHNTVYQLTKGKLAGKYVYVGEACTPTVHRGEPVNPNVTVCNLYGDGNFPGLEIGFNSGPSDQNRPKAWWNQYTMSGHPDGTKTAYGVAMSDCLVSVGAPAGNSGSVISTNPGLTVGSAPGYPHDCL